MVLVCDSLEHILSFQQIEIGMTSVEKRRLSRRHIRLGAEVLNALLSLVKPTKKQKTQ